MDAHASLDRRESQDTFVSLLQLDPSPIESPSPADANKEMPAQTSETMPTSASKSASTGAPGLSGSGHGAIFYRMVIFPLSACFCNVPRSLLTQLLLQ
jgi:hypothetical protein